MMNCLLWKSVTVLSLVWAVRGQPPVSGDLRLVDSSGSTGGRFGRLEVYYSGQWGTVCDDNFSPNDAKVACSQLGFQDYTRYGTVKNDLIVSASSTEIWLDELRCTGSESRLINCLRNIIGVHDCDHTEDVGLFCAINGDLRVLDDSRNGLGPDGRLELFYNDEWGTVCDDSFSPNDARVACRQLGYADYTRYGRVGTLGFSQSSIFTPTWLDDLRCLGNESILINCPANTIGDEDCTHTQDVALVCLANGVLRLVDNSGRTGGSSGRLEIYYNGQWGAVCNDSFSPNDARVACRQLGYTAGYTQYGTVGTLGFNEISSNSPTWLDELRCSGTESELIDCPANAIGVEDCTHTQDVALVCGTASPTSSSPSSSPTSSSNVTSISTGVVTPIIIIAVVIFILFCVFTNRRRSRRVNRSVTRVPVVTNVRSTTVIIATPAKAQDTDYSKQSKPPHSNQAPPQNNFMHASQPAAPYPTGQYPNPAYASYPQQPPASYPTGQYPNLAYASYSQQPPASYPTGQQPPAQYPTGQQPPAQYPTGQQPHAQYPPAQYPTGQQPPAQYLSGGGAPPAYPG